MNIIISPGGVLQSYSLRLFSGTQVGDLQQQLDLWVKEHSPKVIGTELVSMPCPLGGTEFVLQVIYT